MFLAFNTVKLLRKLSETFMDKPNWSEVNFELGLFQWNSDYFSLFSKNKNFLILVALRQSTCFKWHDSFVAVSTKYITFESIRSSYEREKCSEHADFCGLRHYPIGLKQAQSFITQINSNRYK